MFSIPGIYRKITKNFGEKNKEENQKVSFFLLDNRYFKTEKQLLGKDQWERYLCRCSSKLKQFHGLLKEIYMYDFFCQI